MFLSSRLPAKACNLLEGLRAGAQTAEPHLNQYKNVSKITLASPDHLQKSVDPPGPVSRFPWLRVNAAMGLRLAACAAKYWCCAAHIPQNGLGSPRR